jgi:hypothetical protein
VMGVDEAQDGGANLGTSCDLGRSSQPGERALSRRTREVVPGYAGARGGSGMKAMVVYESMFGNTEEVARAVAAGLSGHVSTYVVRAGDELSDLAQEIDLVVLGGPTHAFSMSRPKTREDAVRQGAAPALARRGIREFLGGSRAETWRGPVATFDTRVAKVRHMPGSAARKAAAVARRQGHRLVAEPVSFYVADTHGPLLSGELQRAREWGDRLGVAVEERARAHGSVP